MSALQLEVDALAGEWIQQERIPGITVPPTWHCSAGGGTAFLCYSGQWLVEFWSGTVVELDGEGIHANGPTAADALRRVADAHAVDAAALESLVSGDAREVER